MKVTPLNRKFGKYAPGDVFELPDRAAKVFIKVGKLLAVETHLDGWNPEGLPLDSAGEAPIEPKAPTYETRMLSADVPATPARRPYVRRAPPKSQD